MKISLNTLALLSSFGDASAKHALDVILNSSISYSDLEFVVIEYIAKFDKFVLTL